MANDDRILLNLVLNEATVSAVENRVCNLVNRLNNQNISLNVNGRNLDNIVNRLNDIQQRMQIINSTPVNINANLTSAQQQYRLETERMRVAQQLELSRQRTLQTENQAISALAQQNRTLNINNNVTHQIEQGVQNIGNNMRLAGGHARDFIDYLADGVRYIVIYRTLNEVINQIGEALNEMKNVDTAAIQIRKVTGLSKSEIDAIKKASYSVATEYGRSASEYLESVSEFARAGYKEHSTELGKLSLLTQNVGDVSAESSSKMLLAVDAAYQLEGNVAELTNVVNALNNIANKNPTSMQKMADGLQVSASMAKTAGMDISELTALIGTGTAVTQREGAEIGRALRTITMNIRAVKGTLDDGTIIDDESIAKAEAALKGIGISTKEVVNGVRELRNPMEVLDELADKWHTLGTEAQSVLTESIANKRQANVLSGILDNWSMVEKMQTEYFNSANSAIEENILYLEGWEAKSKVVSAKWTEYISNLVDTKVITGTLDALYGLLTALDTPIGRIATQIVLINTALTFTGRLWQQVRTRSIVADILSLGVAERNLGTALQLVTGHLREQAIAWTASPMGMATIVVTGISLLISGINKYNQSIEEHKRKLKEAAQKASKQAEESSNIVSELLKLKTQLDDGTKSADELTSAFEEQLRAMGWTETEIDNLITKYSGLAGAINVATREALENARTNAHTDVATSSKSLEAEYDGSADIIGQDSTIEGLGRGMSGSGDAELDKQIREVLNSKGFMYDPGNNWYRAKDNSAASIYEYYQGLQEIVQLMQQTASETNDNAILDSYLYKDVRDAVDQLSESANLYGNAISRLHNADAQLELADYLKTNSIASKEAFDEYINGVKNSTEYSDEYKLVLIEVANNAFPQFSRVTETATGNTSDMTTAVKDANTTLSTLQSKLDELKSAQEEYNSTGSITAETMQKLIDNNLLQHLDFSSGKLRVNTSALEAEGEAAKVNAIQKLQDAMATDLMNLATGKTEQLSNTAKTAIANLGTQAETTGSQAETAAGKLAGFAVAAQAAKDGAEGNLTGMSVEDFNIQANAIISAYTKAANGIGSITIKSPKTTSGNSNKNEALDNYLDSIERAYKYHEDELRYINDLQYAYDKLAKSAEEREEILDKINEAQKDYTENQIKDLEHANELLENQGLKGNDTYIANLEKIKQLNHEAAESYRELLRGMGYDNETIEKTDYIQARQKGWYDADNQIKDVLQDNFNNKINDLEHKISLLKNLNEQDEHYGDDSTRLTRYNRTQEINDYYRQLQEEVHNQAEELHKQGYKDDSDEIQELQNKWWEFENTIRDNISNMTDLKITAYTEQLKDEIEALDLQYEKETAIIDALKQKNDLKKQIRDKQAELNAELDASKHAEEWLDEETRKLLFNEEDYSELSDELSKIDSRINRLYRNYHNEINSLDADEWYKQEEITKQFEARLAVQMESYELLEKELEIAKKRTEYENIAKQRNTRVMVAGRWVMTADTSALQEASKSLATLENEKENLEITNAENATIRGMEAINNATNTERLAIQNRIDMINEMTELERKAYADKLPDSVLEGVKVTGGSNTPNEWFNPENKNVRHTGIDEDGNLISESLPEGYSRIADMPQSETGGFLNAYTPLTQSEYKKYSPIFNLATDYAKMAALLAQNAMSSTGENHIYSNLVNRNESNTSNVTQYTFNTGDIRIDNPIGDPNDLVHALATQTRQIFDVTKNMRR